MNTGRVESGIRDFFRSNARGVVAVYLFGSVARGQSRLHSDIDVAVLLESEPPRTFAGLCLDLESDLERQLGRPVDLVVLNKAPCDLVHRILRGGQLLLDRDRARRIRFEVKARNEYFDLAPVLRQYRRVKRSTP